MLFSFDNENLLSDYFSLNKRDDNLFDPSEGLVLGNMFINEYVPYKNYKPFSLDYTNEKDKLLLKIRELCFAVNDLNLMLDLNPNDDRLFIMFKRYNEELKKCIKHYENNYCILELCDDDKEKYSWFKGPWPWEGK